MFSQPRTCVLPGGSRRDGFRMTFSITLLRPTSVGCWYGHLRGGGAQVTNTRNGRNWNNYMCVSIVPYACTSAWITSSQVLHRICIAPVVHAVSDIKCKFPCMFSFQQSGLSGDTRVHVFFVHLFLPSTNNIFYFGSLPVCRRL